MMLDNSSNPAVSSVMCQVLCVKFHVSSVMCKVPFVECHVSCVKCHVSSVIGQVSCVMYKVSSVMGQVLSCVMCQCQASIIECHVSSLVKIGQVTAEIYSRHRACAVGGVEQSYFCVKPELRLG